MYLRSEKKRILAWLEGGGRGRAHNHKTGLARKSAKPTFQILPEAER